MGDDASDTDPTPLLPSASSSTSRPLNPIKLPATCDPPSERNPPRRKVWIVFGATGHLGRSLVRAAVVHDDRVTAVGWTREDKIEEMGVWLSGMCEGRALPAVCDVRVRESVEDVIANSVRHWGRVDVIAICTGFGVIGACEDQSEHELRSQLDTNFFGTLHIIQHSLPHFRHRTPPGGRYLIFSSTAGALGVPGLGPFCASKYAVEGLIESMLYEVDSLGIKATLVQPGHMRLDDDEPPGTTAGASIGLLRPYGAFRVKDPPPSGAYAGETAPAAHARRILAWMGERQPVSTVRSAEVGWMLAHCRFPPLRLLLGMYAVESVRDRMRSIIEEIEDWKHLSFPVAADDFVPVESLASDRGEDSRLQE